MAKVTEVAASLAAPIVAEHQCQLWDVVYEKEAGTWYLRIFIDKEGGVSTQDCEAISRPLSDRLDEVDPIEGSYTLEVGSAGLDRPLRKPEHFAQMMGQEVEVRLYRPVNGSKYYVGILAGYEHGDVTLTLPDGPATFFQKDVAQVKLYVRF